MPFIKITSGLRLPSGECTGASGLWGKAGLTELKVRCGSRTCSGLRLESVSSPQASTHPSRGNQWVDCVETNFCIVRKPTNQYCSLFLDFFFSFSFFFLAFESLLIGTESFHVG